MNPRPATRTAAAGLFAVTAMLTASNAQASPLHRPEPETAMGAAQAKVPEVVLQLLDEGRHTIFVAERRLVHHDVVQTILDSH